ncbi:hypothetical protein B0T26DRAFT_747957 [Lasiosphaeria miniovina]|uniref:Uncharacterized protein n=1 Tax=Lasiosphaeria miniovina TaxID=1954250 RepID=A0AA40B4P5_9PEZI|nr:uncharacterized protein B0T26DRAFT_747957 [Lasiosphaeria miniovina]KAK0727651.1 hypothetical protein B0T26DRAFT_747957 [Lasiosphaeria miniovina]
MEDASPTASVPSTGPHSGPDIGVACRQITAIVEEQAADSKALAVGPERDALVRMGPNILPQVVNKLRDRWNQFGCQLVDPKNIEIEQYYVLKLHAEAARHVSHSDAFTSGPAYAELVKLGQPAVPLAMLAYARGQSGWWHELLFEIVHGRRSGQHCFNKPMLYREWVDWF